MNAITKKHSIRALIVSLALLALAAFSFSPAMACDDEAGEAASGEWYERYEEDFSDLDLMDEAETLELGVNDDHVDDDLMARYDREDGAAIETAEADAESAVEARDTEVDGPQMRVVESALALGVKDRLPVEPGKAFEVGQKIVAWISVINPEEQSDVTLVWSHNGTERWRIDLEVGTSRRGWRTWARKTIRKGDVGDWTVAVVDPSGVVLDTLSFTAVAAAAQPGV